ncbi:MAG: class I SAM-dependent RNA methyltransferase [Clostridia bacterium]|nr:class I SAM-dependent RNA methyltransferase [Clostridia bacterium]MBR3551983.1 class I SAM-dependent RNA methyltransferase [Clostridia bacterium]
MKIHFVIPCLLGLEKLIADEVKALGAADVVSENGRVLFSGDASMLARANICCRYAERIQILVGTFEALSFEDLFQGTRALPWEAWIGATDAFPVKGYSLNSTLFSVRDCQAIIKKAVVERLRGTYGLSWFDETGPIHQIQFSIMKNQVSLLLDTSGYGLHKRGYRLEAGGAPIKETLAASMCCLAHVRDYHTLYDPMCGSGTLLIEGALLANNIAPGRNRNFSAERWDQVPEDVWRLERERARDLELKESRLAAFGSDIDPAALELARANAERAGVAQYLTFERRDLRDFAPTTEKGTLLCNPPYGERLLDMKEAEKLYRLMGQTFPQKRGWSYTIISPDEDFEACFGRKADKRRKLYNGMIKCQVFMYYK